MDDAFPSLAKRIETERLVLRPFEFSDVDDVVAYAADPEWSRFLAYVAQPFERTHAEQFIAQRVLRDWRTRPTWVMEMGDRGLGGIGLQVEPEHRSAGVNYGLARSHWGKGLATEAALRVIDTAFNAWPELNRVHSATDARNVASQRVMEKVGMRHEGTLRQDRLRRGEFVDWVVFGLLREDWEQARKGR